VNKILIFFCEDWACATSEIEDNLIERKFFIDILSACKNASAPETYVAFHRLLINHPLPTEPEPQQHRTEEAQR